MTMIWPLPQIEIRELTSIEESRPTALLTGRRAWGVAGSLMELPLVVQAEPVRADRNFFQSMADNLPPQVEVVYGIGGGLACDAAKYIGHVRNLPTVLVPTVLSADGFFTGLVAVREHGTVAYEETGPVDKVIIDWEIIRSSPRHLRGAAITELLTIVIGLLDWRYAAENNKTTPTTRYQPWAAAMAAGIAQQAFKIAKGVGEGNVESLRNLLDLVCMEVQLTNQLGHNRPQEGSEQFFAYAIEQKAGGGNPVPYGDLVGPGILVGAALHGQDITPIRDTLMEAGIRLDQLRSDDISSTIRILPQYVRQHELPYSILNDLDVTSERVSSVLETTGLGV